MEPITFVAISEQEMMLIIQQHYLDTKEGALLEEIVFMFFEDSYNNLIFTMIHGDNKFFIDLSDEEFNTKGEFVGNRSNLGYDTCFVKHVNGFRSSFYPNTLKRYSVDKDIEPDQPTCPGGYVDILEMLKENDYENIDENLVRDALESLMAIFEHRCIVPMMDDKEEIRMFVQVKETRLSMFLL